ncbi:MAG TPA: hypothetical protein VNI83_08990 [Vicinamibacterales bacterium]|nr:hypothetical protein [Vicinamibacterales bacterium]
MRTMIKEALLDTWSSASWDHGVQLEELGELERLVVRTQHSVYEIIVLPGGTGEVLVRGGRYFPVFTQAVLDGSSAGGTFLKRRGVYPGLRLEFVSGTRRVVTSPVRTIAVAHEAAKRGCDPVM